MFLELENIESYCKGVFGMAVKIFFGMLVKIM